MCFHRRDYPVSQLRNTSKGANTTIYPSPNEKKIYTQIFVYTECPYNKHWHPLARSFPLRLYSYLHLYLSLYLYLYASICVSAAAQLATTDIRRC